MYAIEDIQRLADRYAGTRKIAASTLARQASGSSTWLERCASGRVTIRSALAVVQWLSDHWPPDLEWPRDIERPEPAPGSRAAAIFGPLAAGGASVAALEGTERRRDDDASDGIRLAARRAESARVGAGMRIGPSGRIACPMAICQALGVRRHVYDDVVRRYRDETGAGRSPRAGSKCDCMLTALIAAGDVRFASRRAKMAA